MRDVTLSMGSCPEGAGGKHTFSVFWLHFIRNVISQARSTRHTTFHDDVIMTPSSSHLIRSIAVIASQSSCTSLRHTHAKYVFQVRPPSSQSIPHTSHHTEQCRGSLSGCCSSDDNDGNIMVQLDEWSCNGSSSS